MLVDERILISAELCFMRWTSNHEIGEEAMTDLHIKPMTVSLKLQKEKFML
jgi:hypothetical protein